jgi:alkylresorcinol/alkylpyrone synthase
MPRLASLSAAVPPHAIAQDEARRMCETVYADAPDLLRLLRIFTVCGVEKRHFAFPAEHYLRPRGFEERNREFIEKGVELAADAARSALARAGTRPDQIDHVLVATTTGLATPSLDALLVSRLGLRSDVRRWPLFGLGCAGGVGALSRAGEIVRGAPRQRALVVSVELCGQVFSHQARTPVDIVGVAIFADGAAAAVVTGDEVPSVDAPKLLHARSQLFEGSETLMGWSFTNDGPRLVLSESISDLIKGRLRDAVEAALNGAGLAPRNVKHWALHPGGRRILEVYAEVLGLGEEALGWAKRSLARFGNVSSASALFVLADLLAAEAPRPGDKALLAAPGPGFGLETLVLSWG